MPDLAERPFDLEVEHVFPLSAARLYTAWTDQLDVWFAAPGSVLMTAQVNAPFFFETEYKAGAQSAKRHPHYGRFLRLIPDRLVQITWVTGAGGTEGAETVVTVELQAQGDGCRLKLTHAGFATAASRDATEHAWPMVFEQMQRKLAHRSEENSEGPDHDSGTEQKQ
jgi:uncharacterized protein YndB with AHSA1/START domain